MNSAGRCEFWSLPQPYALEIQLLLDGPIFLDKYKQPDEQNIYDETNYILRWFKTLRSDEFLHLTGLRQTCKASVERADLPEELLLHRARHAMTTHHLKKHDGSFLSLPRQKMPP